MTTTDKTDNAVLAIVERAFRGALEKQFFDALYLAAEMHRSLGGMDVLLRGAAAVYALPAPPGALVLGGLRIDTLPDAREDLSRLVDAGSGIFVEHESLAAHGLGGRTDLLAGVTAVERGSLARRWLDYRTVCFL